MARKQRHSFFGRLARLFGERPPSRRHGSFRPRLELLEDRCLPSTVWQVTNTLDYDPNDVNDPNYKDGGSLRYVLTHVQAGDQVRFSLAANNPNHVYYINDGIAGHVTHDVAHLGNTTAADD